MITQEERIATLLTALEEALDMADKYMSIYEQEQGGVGTRLDYQLLKGFAESERYRLNKQGKEGES